MTAMKTYYKFSDWKSTKETCNIGPQTEAILLVFYDIPCFFSQMELEVFLGYVSPNRNVDGALVKLVEKEMLVKATNKVGTPIYYLGKFAMEALDHTKLPDKDARQNQSLESINIRSDNGHRVIRNKRQTTARTPSSNKRQESSASNKGSKRSSVTPLAKKGKPNPNTPIFTSDEESSKNPTAAPSKDKDGALINGKSTSDGESENNDGSSSIDKESEKSKDSPPSDKESEKSDHSSTKFISICWGFNYLSPVCEVFGAIVESCISRHLAHVASL
jgi:hypothetical protein